MDLISMACLVFQVGSGTYWSRSDSDVTILKIPKWRENILPSPCFIFWERKRKSLLFSKWVVLRFLFILFFLRKGKWIVLFFWRMSNFLKKERKSKVENNIFPSMKRALHGCLRTSWSFNSRKIKQTIPFLRKLETCFLNKEKSLIPFLDKKSLDFSSRK